MNGTSRTGSPSSRSNPGSCLRLAGASLRCVGALLCLLSAATACAQTVYTWTGALSGDWGTPGNWSPNGVPGATQDGTDIAEFGPSARVAVTVTSAASAFDFGTLKFLSDAPAYTFTLDNPTFDFFIEDGIANQSSTTHPSFTVSSSDCLCIYAGDFADSRITNAGKVLADGPATTAGSASIVNQSGGTVQIEGSDSASATLVNQTGGYVAVGNANWMFGSLSGGGNVNIGPNAVTLGSLNTDDTISGVMYSDNGGSLTKTGTGTLTLRGANTYTGLTTIESGTLEVDGSLLGNGTVVLQGGGLSQAPATLAGSGSVGGVSMDADTFLVAGDANPNTKLTMASLGCNGTNDDVRLRIGNSGSATHGTYLHLISALHAGNCPFLRFLLTGAGEPLVAGESYLIAVMDSATDYTTANLGYVLAVPGYPQAKGHFFVFSSSTFSDIFFMVDDIGDAIFTNGFELFN
jgi:autotransporter-associated beta strand protein